MRGALHIGLAAATLIFGCGSNESTIEESPLDGWKPAPWGACQSSCGSDKPVQLAAGFLHTCARMSDGTVRCWGDDSAGQLAGSTRIQPIAGLTGVAEIAAGAYHTCARTEEGAVYCWGANGLGQLGDDTVTPRDELVRVRRLIGKTARRIFVGTHTSCAVISEGTAVCWGNVGMGTNVEPPSFWALLGTDIDEIAMGGGHIVRKTDGTIRWHTFGGGLVTMGLSAIQGAVSMAAGGGISLVAMPNGEVRGWGAFGLKQIGTHPTQGAFFDNWLPYQAGVMPCGSTTPCLPTTAAWATGVKRVVLNKMQDSETVHACLLKLDGTVACFGHNHLGQQGKGSLDPKIGAYYTVSNTTPTTVPGLANITELVLGGTHGCALDDQSRVFCFGDAAPAYPSSKLGRPEQTSGSSPSVPISFTPAP